MVPGSRQAPDSISGTLWNVNSVIPVVDRIHHGGVLDFDVVTVEAGTRGIGRSSVLSWENICLAGILAIAAALYGWSLGDRVLQPYYAAAVRSMTESGTAFLFAGFDPAGVISIDKTPLAFWAQGVGVWVFGYHWWAISLVQAVEGVASVFVLHRAVRLTAGERPALVAALVLAVSPINTAINRENEADVLMVLLLLLAAYCVIRAVDRGGAGWLVGAGALVGLGFLTKMLAAWVVLPALAVASLAAPVSWPRRLLRLLTSGAVCAAVSLVWLVFVSLWPAASRPYVGSTTDDSIWQLVFGYNGFGRFSAAGSLGTSYVAQFSGAPGPLRLFDSFLGGQIGWLLPVASATVIGGALVWVRTRAGTPTQRAGWLLWGGWLIVAGLLFSFAGGIFHRYYTAELAPAVAALVGMGLSACWGWYRTGRPVGLSLPLAVVATVGFAFVVLDRVPDWQPWLRVAIVVAGAVCALVLVLAFPGRRLLSITPRPVAVLAVVVMLAGPVAFSVDTALTPQDVVDSADPGAGPATTDYVATATRALGSTAAARSYVTSYVAFMSAAPGISAGQRAVLDYVTRHAPDAPVQLAVEFGSWGADPYLLNSPAKVAAFGGYAGTDPSPTVAQLSAWAGSGRLGYVLWPAALLRLGAAQAAQRSAGSVLAGRITWVTRHCARVPPNGIGPAAADAGVLFDCRGR